MQLSNIFLQGGAVAPNAVRLHMPTGQGMQRGRMRVFATAEPESPAGEESTSGRTEDALMARPATKRGMEIALS